MIDEHDPELLWALGVVRDTLTDEDADEHLFYPAADQFLLVLHAHLQPDEDLDEWDPRPALTLLEGQLATDRSRTSTWPPPARPSRTASTPPAPSSPSRISTQRYGQRLRG